MRKMLITLLLILVLCSGCGSNPANNTVETQLPTDDIIEPIEYSYVKETVDYTEKNEQYSFRMDMERTDTDKAHYLFEKKIADEQRRACIEATEQILAQLGELPNVPEICVLTEKSYGSLFVVGNRVFLSEQDWQTREYVTNVLMAVYGDFTHYGLAYGYSNLLCQRLNWDEPVDGAFVVPSVIEVCDLGLLCFDTAFVSEEDANAAKNIACHFAASCDENTLKQLISLSDTTEGMESVSSALAEYYAENDLTYQPSVVRYGFGAISYDYIVEDEAVTFYICDDWYDRRGDVNPLVSENFLHENYSEIKAYFEINLRQMYQYRELFGLEPYPEEISFVFSDDPYIHESEYDARIDRANILSVVSTMHEYIHALTNSASLVDWEVEGFARYFDLRYDYYGTPVTNYDYNNLSDDIRYQMIKEYIDNIGRPLDMSIDYLTIYDLVCYSWGLREPVNYISGASYIGYLVSQYGEEQVIHSIYGERTPLPKSNEELVAEWNAYLDDKYQGYSKWRE